MLPNFTINNKIIVQNWVYIFFEFGLWLLSYKELHIKEYSRESNECMLLEITDLVDSSGLNDMSRER